jgi:TolB-like protein
MRIAGVFCLGFLVAGCQLISPFAEQQAQDSGGQQQAEPFIDVAAGNYLPPNAALMQPTKPLSDYAADLALQLLQSMQYQAPAQPIAISSFVQLDSALAHSNALGNQLAEHLFVQLHRLGVAVADIKVARHIRVTPQGDIALSRGAYLDKQQRAVYVLTGTMLQDNAGVVVNARVVNVQSKALLASGQIHIPQFVLTSAQTHRQAP